MENINQLSHEFAQILGGKAKITPSGCSVSLKRDFNVLIQGRPSHSVVPVGLSFESLDNTGLAINIGEITLLEEEIPYFTQSVVSNGLIVAALHNHWLYTKPNLMYLHVQSIEPPLDFARKLAQAFSTLRSHPVSDNG